jgi:hypothetical protein
MQLTRTFRTLQPVTSMGIERIEQFTTALVDGVDLGFVGPAHQMDRGRVTVSTEWVGEELLTVTVDATDITLLADDVDLVVRGLANCLDMAGVDVAGGPPAAPSWAPAYDAALRQQRALLTCEVEEDESWAHDRSSHVIIEFHGPVDTPLVKTMADATTTLERLVWGMCPLDGDTYSDVGDTALVQLQPNVIDYWVDCVYALPADWKRRFEAMFIAHGARLRPRVIKYEP